MTRELVSASLVLFAAVAVARGGAPPPGHIRVIAEYIEVSHPVVTEVMQEDAARSGPRLHGRMRTLAAKGKARILETSIIVARSGEKAAVESIAEYIYPTENDFGGWIGCGGTLGQSPPGALSEPNFPVAPTLRPLTPTAFETRNVGTVLEIFPTVGTDRRVIDLELAPELVVLLRHQIWTEHTDEWGAAPIRLPIFESLEVSTSITLLNGQFGLVGALTPRDTQGGRDPSRKVLLFIRADVMPLADPASE